MSDGMILYFLARKPATKAPTKRAIRPVIPYVGNGLPKISMKGSNYHLHHVGLAHVVKQDTQAQQATKRRRLITKAIIEQTKAPVTMPLVLPCFLAAVASTMPPIATIKTGNGGMMDKSRLTIPSTIAATAKP
jgi:hypothetical protein